MNEILSLCTPSLSNIQGLIWPKLMSRTTLNISDIALLYGASQKTAELTALIDFLRPYELRTVIEIGSKKGGTLVLWMLLGTPDAHILGIDLPHGPFGGGNFAAEQEHVTRKFIGRDQRMWLFRQDSHDQATLEKLINVLANRKADLLFIDGDHTYEGVKQDFDMYSRFVKPGGLIMFHDIVDHPGFIDCQVHRFWSEIKIGHTHWEFIEPNHDIGFGPWGGIGIIEFGLRE
jgi:predicted O-methyltransferase YrrM